MNWLESFLALPRIVVVDLGDDRNFFEGCCDGFGYTGLRLVLPDVGCVFQLSIDTTYPLDHTRLLAWVNSELDDADCIAAFTHDNGVWVYQWRDSHHAPCQTPVSRALGSLLDGIVAHYLGQDEELRTAFDLCLAVICRGCPDDPGEVAVCIEQASISLPNRQARLALYRAINTAITWFADYNELLAEGKLKP